VRQVVLDTETTGLEVNQGHRIIEIGCVELVNRRVTDNCWHHYINPDREIDAGAFEVHGISNEDLVDKPHFIELADDFLSFIEGAELVIHNAPFDVGFLDKELAGLGDNAISLQDGRVLDTLVMARQKHPGQKNNLDALCKRYGIDNSHRSVHGALLDARILADVYLAMTGGQTSLGLDEVQPGEVVRADVAIAGAQTKVDLPLWSLDATTQTEHQAYLEFLATQCENPVWK